MTEAERQRASLTRSAALASIATALFLMALKAWALWRTDSAAMLGSLADSSLDLLASLAALIGLWVAAMPADANHRFGHGKAEALAAMAQVVLISLSAVGLAVHSVSRLIGGARVASAEEGVAVSLVAMVATLALMAWQKRVIARTGSLAVRTDHLHYKSDLMLNLGVIAALVLDRFAGVAMADPLFGLAIAAWLAWNALQASVEAVGHLMDHEWDEDRRQQLVALVARQGELTSVHDLRTRTSGARDFAQFHISVDPATSVAEAHRIMDQIEARIAAEFPGVEVLIHVDPAGLDRATGLAAEELLPEGRVQPPTG